MLAPHVAFIFTWLLSSHGSARMETEEGCGKPHHIFINTASVNDQKKTNFKMQVT